MKKKLKLDDVDVAFDPTPLSELEKQLISDFIRQDKIKQSKKQARKRVTSRA
jgi:hypothetical protein